MIAFLTDLLNPVSPIEDVIFLDKEMEAGGEEMRSVIYDLRCKTQDGDEFIVEMQNKGQKHFSNRILYYLSHAILEQGEKGTSWNFDLHPVYGRVNALYSDRFLRVKSLHDVCDIRVCLCYKYLAEPPDIKRYKACVYQLF